jgi:hypothetical protein
VFRRSALSARYGSPVRDTDRNWVPVGRGAAECRIVEHGWRKASHSLGNGECIEVADGLSGRMAVRDSKNPAGSILVYSADEWKSFLAKIKI